MSSPPGLRTCIGCRGASDRTALVRVVLSPPGAEAPAGPPAVVPDPRGSAPGHGAWLHPGTACLARALKGRAFHRAFRTSVSTEELETLWAQQDPAEED